MRRIAQDWSIIWVYFINLKGVNPFSVVIVLLLLLFLWDEQFTFIFIYISPHFWHTNWLFHSIFKVIFIVWRVIVPKWCVWLWFQLVICVVAVPDLSLYIFCYFTVFVPRMISSLECISIRFICFWLSGDQVAFVDCQLDNIFIWLWLSIFVFVLTFTPCSCIAFDLMTRITRVQRYKSSLYLRIET